MRTTSRAGAGHDTFLLGARAVQRFSRHRGPRVLSVYDDNREDLGGQVAVLVAEAAA